MKRAPSVLPSLHLLSLLVAEDTKLVLKVPQQSLDVRVFTHQPRLALADVVQGVLEVGDVVVFQGARRQGSRAGWTRRGCRKYGANTFKGGRGSQLQIVSQRSRPRDSGPL